MGLLNNWLNKKKKEQLKKTGERSQASIAQEKKSESKPKKVLSANSIAYQVLLKPLITEKSAIAESISKYSFRIAIWANKGQVKKAVQEIYGITPSDVNVINVEGRNVRFGKNQGRRSDYKKAVVSLPAGKTIDIHAGV